MKELLGRLVRDEEGANAVEYGLIAAVVAVALIAALVIFRDSLSNLFQRQAGEIDNQ